MQTPQLDIDLLMSTARQRSGLHDFGELWFLPALEQLTDSLRTEAQLSEAGQFAQFERLVNLLINRLRLLELQRQHPEILDEDITAPIIIVGLPRTGTTLLSRVLSNDPRFYALYWWESRNPAPFADEAMNDPQPRIAAAETMIEQMLQAVPRLASIHPFDARAHDEEVLLLEHTFYSTVPESGAWLPTYQHWLEQQDQSRAYAELKWMLQCLQWQKKQRGTEATRWVLKTPHHLHFMPTVSATFPDAVLVHTHRDPVDTMPSMASMYTTLHELGSEQIKPPAIARQLLEKWAASLERCMQFRDQQTQHRIIDIHYSQLTAAPEQCLAQLYQALGIPLEQEHTALIQQWLADNRRENRARHHYQLDDFELDEAHIRSAFHTYHKRFIAPHTDSNKEKESSNAR